MSADHDSSNDHNSDDAMAEFATLNAARLQAKLLKEARVESEALIYPPDWSLWRNAHLLSIPVLVALSCGIDPYKRETLATREYLRRLAIVRLRQGWDEPHVKWTHESWTEAKVSLAEFRETGESLDPPFTFPPEYPAASPQGRKKSDNNSKQLATLERETLLGMIGALCELAGIDLRNDTKGHAEAKMLAPLFESRGVRLTSQTIASKIAAARELISPKGPPT
jgi:hypothetical protein